MITFFGYLLIAVGVIFIFIGLLGIYRFKNFYARLLAAADIDTVGLILILVGVTVLSGFNAFSFKVILILGLIVVINPIVSSSIASSAFFSGYKIKEEEKDDGS